MSSVSQKVYYICLHILFDFLCSLRFLNLWIDTIHQFWKILNQYFFKCWLCTHFLPNLFSWPPITKTVSLCCSTYFLLYLPYFYILFSTTCFNLYIFYRPIFHITNPLFWHVYVVKYIYWISVTIILSLKLFICFLL